MVDKAKKIVEIYIKNISTRYIADVRYDNFEYVVTNVFPIWDFIYKNKYMKFNKDMTRVGIYPGLNGLKSPNKSDIILIPYSDNLLLFTITSKFVVNDVADCKVELIDSINMNCDRGNISIISSSLMNNKFKPEMNILKYFGVNY